MKHWVFVCSVQLVLVGCASEPEPVSIRLVDLFEVDLVADSQAPEPPEATTEWRFDGSSTLPSPEEHRATVGWWALHGVRDLRVVNGALAGRTGENALLAVKVPETLDKKDRLYAIELRMHVSAGENVGLELRRELDAEAIVDRASRYGRRPLSVSLVPGEAMQTYTLTSASSDFDPSFPFADMGYLFLQPSDVADAEFAIESVRIVSRKEHLASIPSGIGWQGLNDVYRETLVTRTPESVPFRIELPSNPFLEVSLGTIEDSPVTFRITATGSGNEKVLLERTVTRAEHWETAAIELADFASRPLELTFSTSSTDQGKIGYWGTPVVRNRGAEPQAVESSPARAAVTHGNEKPPRGVIVIVIDTLRRDHLQSYGYERETAPVLTELARSGARFDDNISQGTWTKVSVPSILTSLYPSTHGITDAHHRVPASVTTLAEAYYRAGYATFATSSIPFTGKLSNLHQGIEVLHERSSIGDLDEQFRSKTGRAYVDRLLPWLEAHRDVPFFAFLHAFDPHSPFRPQSPYDTLWMTPDELAQHEKQVKKIQEYVENPHMQRESLPMEEELARSGIDREAYLRNEKAWYDGSILAVDTEIGRVLERLRELDLEDDVVVAVIADHGEEFLEHGRHFHGYTAYGEMLNVPLMLWGPGYIPAGRVIEETTESIDLMPTLLELSRLPIPRLAQGQSLLPLLAERVAPNALGWRRRPAFAERARDNTEKLSLGPEVESLVIVSDGFKLIKNGRRPADWPEYELYNHDEDPLDLKDVAKDHPEIVARLKEQLDNWHKAALAARVSSEDDVEGLSTEDRERLRSLGYVQ